MTKFSKLTFVFLFSAFAFSALNAQAYLIPSSVNFGRIQCNSSASRTVTFVNNSNQTVQNVNVSVSGISFSASAFCPYSMAPNSSCSIDVTYRPHGQPGNDFATLWVNAYPLSSDLVNLDGSCYTP